MMERWYAALHAPYGVVLETDDRERLRAKLYAVRRGLMDPDLDKVAIVFSPLNPNHVWLVKRNIDGPPQVTDPD